MSDYNITTDFSLKDGLSAGDPEKLIIGSDFDVEFDAIAVAIATKYDGNDIASTVQAQAETSNVVLMTPLRVAEWADANLGLVGDLQALTTDPAADRLLFFDDTDNTLKFLTLGANIAITGTTIDVATAGLETAINHDNLTGFVANEHLDWTADLGANNMNDANIVASNVTQHQAALSITKSQLSDLATIAQAEAEAGTATTDRLWTAQRVAQAIAALSSGAPTVAGAKVHDNSAQVIANTTFTAKVWDTEAYDTNNYHDNVTNNTRLTIPTGVTRVRLTAHILWDFFNGNSRSIKIRKNGVDGAVDDAVITFQPKISVLQSQDSGGTHGMNIDSGIITVAPGDYFEVLVWQNSGGNLNVTAYQSWFQIEAFS